MDEASLLPDLICPRCRQPGAWPPIASVLVPGAGGETLVCRQPRCGARYPILDGVPVVLRDLDTFLAHQGVVALVPILGGEAHDFCLAHLPPEHPLRQAREGLAANVASGLAPYLDHPADGVPPAGPGAAPTSGEPLERWLDRWLPEGARRALDVGCSVGGTALALARRVPGVVAMDMLMAPLRLLRELRDEGRADVPLRVVGSRYRTTRCRLPDGVPEVPGREHLLVLAADALDPPLPAEHFDVVHLGNIVDNARSALLLLGQADALLRPGGRLFVTCASSYRADITPEAEWLGATARDGIEGIGPEDALVHVLEGRHPHLPHLRYRILEDRRRLPWMMARDDRCRVVYDVHAVVAEKLAPPAREP